MLLAKCLQALPNDCCMNIKDIIQDDNYFFTYDKKNNTVYIDVNDILFDFSSVYNRLNTLIILFNPKIEIKMHYSSKSRYYQEYVFFESEFPEFILDEWFYGLNIQKVIMIWGNEYFK